MSSAGIWRGPQGKELKPPTNTHVSEPESKYSKYFRDFNQQFDWNLMRNLEPEQLN